MALIEARDITPEDALAALTRRLANPVQSFSWQDIEREMHARSFTVAKSAGYDILDDIGEAMHKAVAGGETVESFKKKLTPILQDAGWWGRSEEVDPLTGETVDVQLGSARRLETIFDTNMRTSYAAGRYLSIERNKQSQPYMRYVAVQDDRTRPLHRAWDGTTLPVDDPWWDDHYPPCGWGCRCTVIALSQRQVDAMEKAGEIKLAAPVSTTRTFVNKRTGSTTEVPQGVDPDFAYHPGKALLKALADAE